MKQYILNQRIVVTALLAALLMFTGCSKATKDADSEDNTTPSDTQINSEKSSNSKLHSNEIIRPVHGLLVGVETKVKQHRFNGIVKAGKESRLSFRVAGNVTNLTAQIGQHVGKGQHIADLDATDYHVNVTQTLANQNNVQANRQATFANIKQAESELMRARSAYLRAEKLYETDSISVSEFEQYRTTWQAASASMEATNLQLSSASAQLQASRQQVKTATNQLAYTKLRAPFSGVISQVLVEANEQISAGQPVVLLSSNRDTEIEIGLPASIINTVKKGDPIQASFFNFPNRQFMGKVIKVGFSTGNSSVYPVVVKLNQAESSIRPGMSADVLFVNQKNITTSITLPATAIGEDKDGKFVYKLIPEKNPATSTDTNNLKTVKTPYLVKRQPITIGNMSANGFVITKGILVGELIAKAGLNIIQDGDAVVLFNQNDITTKKQARSLSSVVATDQ